MDEYVGYPRTVGGIEGFASTMFWSCQLLRTWLKSGPCVNSSNHFFSFSEKLCNQFAFTLLFVTLGLGFLPCPPLGVPLTSPPPPSSSDFIPAAALLRLLAL